MCQQASPSKSKQCSTYPAFLYILSHVLLERLVELNKPTKPGANTTSDSQAFTDQQTSSSNLVMTALPNMLSNGKLSPQQTRMVSAWHTTNSTATRQVLLKIIISVSLPRLEIQKYLHAACNIQNKIRRSQWHILYVIHLQCCC